MVIVVRVVMGGSPRMGGALYGYDAECFQRFLFGFEGVAMSAVKARGDGRIPLWPGGCNFEEPIDPAGDGAPLWLHYDFDIDVVDVEGYATHVKRY